MPLEDSPLAPSLPWHASSAVVLGVSGMLCRAFLYGGNRVKINGLDGFLNLLDKREDVEGRERGLITGWPTFNALWPRSLLILAPHHSLESYQCVRTCNICRHIPASHSLMCTSYSMDDPLMWGVLPLKYLWNPNAMRWSLGSHDIVFRNK